MKLIKISDTHYIVVGDTVGFTYNEPTYNSDGKIGKAENSQSRKITHSTQPLEITTWKGKTNLHMDNHHYDKIKPLNLSEIEEAINGYSVEKMALEKYPTNENWMINSDNADKRLLWIQGFKTHQELVKDKLFTTEDVENCVKHILRCLNTHNEADKPVNFVWNDYFKPYIQSLLPKTEWDIEINEQGKIKLI